MHPLCMRPSTCAPDMMILRSSGQPTEPFTPPMGTMGGSRGAIRYEDEESPGQELDRGLSLPQKVCRCGILVLLWLAVMVAGCLSYVWAADSDHDGNLNDKAGGWATDFVLALAAVLFGLSTKLVAEDRFVVFYLGTALAYGLGGAGHFYEGSEGSGGVAYYTLMTLAFGGDALRSAYGYALPSSRAVFMQRCFTAVVFGVLCVSAVGSLKMISDGTASHQVQKSATGRAYLAAQVCMAFVEASGSLVWLLDTPAADDRLPLIGASVNISSWMLVKFVPPVFAQQGISTTVAHRWSHYMQFILIFLLHTMSLQSALAAKRSSK